MRLNLSCKHCGASLRFAPTETLSYEGFVDVITICSTCNHHHVRRIYRKRRFQSGTARPNTCIKPFVLIQYPRGLVA
jgi:hypothetical protein